MSDAPEPDLEIAAETTARELRFRRRPQVEIHADDSVSVRERLPRPVGIGVTYRRIRAAMRAAARLRA
jgi:hypothetical protein